MKNHEVRTHKSAEDFPNEEHLAYKVAEVAADPVEVPAETTDMIINRIIDNAAVAMTRSRNLRPRHGPGALGK